jgi:hypothetical protein
MPSPTLRWWTRQRHEPELVRIPTPGERVRRIETRWAWVALGLASWAVVVMGFQVARWAWRAM